MRTAEYPGVGSSLAWSHPVTLGAGQTLVRRVAAVVADGRLDRGAAGDLAKLAKEAVTP